MLYTSTILLYSLSAEHASILTKVTKTKVKQFNNLNAEEMRPQEIMSSLQLKTRVPLNICSEKQAV